jgi:cyanophycinase
VICGTSAGAAALTALTMAGGEIDEEGNLVEQYLGPASDCSTSRRSSTRTSRSVAACSGCSSSIAGNPELMGLGIDEDTALIVSRPHRRGGRRGGVTFVDGRDSVRFDNADDLEKGRSSR